MQSIRMLDSSDDAVWAATSGGVFSYRIDSGELKTYTPVEGLFGADVKALTYDPARNVVWIGYGQGVLDRLDVETGSVDSFFDISRADQFIDRTINRLRLYGDSLYVSTAFGVVVFDPVMNEVRDTYSRFGNLAPAIPVRDVLQAPLPDGNPGLWVATEDGVVRAPLDSPNLQQPSSWTVEDSGPSDVTGLAYYTDKVHACALDTYARQADGSWTPVFFTSRQFVELIAEGDRLYAVSNFTFYRRIQGIGSTLYQVAGLRDFSAAVIASDGSVWLGDAIGGLLRFPPLGDETGPVTIVPTQVVIPTGPLLNQIADIDVAPDGTLWVSHKRPGQFTGISRLTDGAWTVYSGNDPDVDVASEGYESAHVAPDGTFYAGSNGDGLTEVRADGTVLTHRADNSSLGPVTAQSDADFIVVTDAASDENGRIWVTNTGAVQPLHVLSSDGVWTALPYPSGVPSSVRFGRITIDSFDQKWISGLPSITGGGRGLLVVSTGSDPLSFADDEAILIDAVGSAGTGLPHEKVNAIAIDASDRLWLGTDRGLASILAVGSAFGGDPSLVQPQWARTADGTSFLLRDLNIADIAIDPADQKWIASTTGAWLLNAAGDEVVLNLTQENSPLLSDNVVAVAVDEASGRVYFATDVGLLSLDGEATAPAPTVQDLAVAPSPYRPELHAGGVLITGLVEQTDVRITTLDGRLVATLASRGGSIRWNGRDDRSGDFVSSGVYIVSAIAADGRGTAHGRIAVIR